MAENVTPNTTVSTGQITTVQTTVSQANGTATPPNGATPPITTGVLNTTEVPKATEPPTEDDPETGNRKIASFILQDISDGYSLCFYSRQIKHLKTHTGKFSTGRKFCKM
jgi:hypothetical protein